MEIGFLLFCGIFWLIGGLICGMIGKSCAQSRGRGDDGFMLGFLLGPLGIILSLFLPADLKGMEANKPGGPVKRQRAEYKKPDPIEEFEARERAKKAFEEVPGQMREKMQSPVVVPLKRAEVSDEKF